MVRIFNEINQSDLWRKKVTDADSDNLAGSRAVCYLGSDCDVVKWKGSEDEYSRLGRIACAWP